MQVFQARLLGSNIEQEVQCRNGLQGTLQCHPSTRLALKGQGRGENRVGLVAQTRHFQVDIRHAPRRTGYYAPVFKGHGEILDRHQPQRDVPWCRRTVISARLLLRGRLFRHHVQGIVSVP